MKPVSGIAMGLIKNAVKKKNMLYCLIFLVTKTTWENMDFKVTSTRDGITATQMDIKVDGLSYDILEKALESSQRDVCIFLIRLLNALLNLVLN